MKIDNITLIGMPGSGKSTIGKLLAKRLNFKFIDCDEYIERKEKMSLPQIIDSEGDGEFIKLEAKRILELLPLKKHVLAPGGSIIYSKKLINTLRDSSFIIFLNMPLKVLAKRLTRQRARRINWFGSKSIKELYNERFPFYKKYADFTINYSRKSNSEIVNEIIKKWFEKEIML